MEEHRLIVKKDGIEIPVTLWSILTLQDWMDFEMKKVRGKCYVPHSQRNDFLSRLEKKIHEKDTSQDTTVTHEEKSTQTTPTPKYSFIDIPEDVKSKFQYYLS